MNLYRACIILNIWPIAKARSEIWQISNSNQSSLNDLKKLAKKNFKKLATQRHPDIGGSSEAYIEIQQAYDTIKSATAVQFIRALKDEIEDSKIYYKSGDKACYDCKRWSDLARSCVMERCVGFELLTKRHYVSGFNKARKQRNNKLQGQGSFSERGRGLG